MQETTNSALMAVSRIQFISGDGTSIAIVYNNLAGLNSPGEPERGLRNIARA
jgi:hypothetical protein